MRDETTGRFEGVSLPQIGQFDFSHELFDMLFLTELTLFCFI